MANAYEPALSLRGLCKHYGDVVAMDNITLDVAPGEFLTLLGPSGSGKTSILMAIGGFEKPDAGEILLNGVRINDLPPERRNFGVVFQGYALFPHMSVRANVGYSLSVRGMAREQIGARVARVLDLVQLSAFAERLPRQLSGGQQQRVALARALVFEPALVLLDEPLSALDKKLRAELQAELKALHARLRTTFVLVTHDQEEALALSDRIVILRNGKVVQTGRPSELYYRPANRFVAEFLGSANFFSGTVAQTNGDILSVQVGAKGINVASPSHAPAPQLGDWVTLALRPEHVRFVSVDDPAPNGNYISGKVASVTFTGQQHTYRTDTPLGSLAVVIPASGNGDLKPVGSEVRLGWSSDAMILVAE